MPLRMVLCRALLAGGLIASAGACNSRDPVLDSPVAPTRSAAPFPSLSAQTLGGVAPSERAIVGGRSTHGTVVLGRLAPAGGVAVALSSSDPAVTVPAFATVPAGASRVDFPIVTQAVPVDRQAMITASAAGEAVSSPLTIWTATPPFFSFVSGLAAFEPATVARLSADNAAFSAFCQDSMVWIRVVEHGFGGRNWNVVFAAPIGAPLTAGTYEQASASSSATRPRLEVPAPYGSNCTGRFVVHDVELSASGEVGRFWVTFEERCQLGPSVIGDLRVTDAPRLGLAPTSCLLP